MDKTCPLKTCDNADLWPDYFLLSGTVAVHYLKQIDPIDKLKTIFMKSGNHGNRWNFAKIDVPVINDSYQVRRVVIHSPASNL